MELDVVSGPLVGPTCQWGEGEIPFFLHRSRPTTLPPPPPVLRGGRSSHHRIHRHSIPLLPTLPPAPLAGMAGSSAVWAVHHASCRPHLPSSVFQASRPQQRATDRGEGPEVERRLRAARRHRRVVVRGGSGGAAPGYPEPHQKPGTGKSRRLPTPAVAPAPAPSSGAVVRLSSIVASTPGERESRTGSVQQPKMTAVPLLASPKTTGHRKVSQKAKIRCDTPKLATNTIQEASGTPPARTRRRKRTSATQRVRRQGDKGR
jgi:hypothetical protein